MLHSRRAFQDMMLVDAITVVRELVGRRVAAFMRSNDVDRDLAVEVFILEPVSGDGLDAPSVDRHGSGASGHRPDLDGHGLMG